MGDTLWIVTILLVHFVADFVVQTRWQAENKSKDWGALVSHVGTYWAFLHLFAAFAPSNTSPWYASFVWAVVNGVLHFATDAITSRQTAKRWNDGKPTKGFWVWIGFDQFIHAATLIVTWAWIVGGAQ
jgi:hypothetical protein